MATNLETLEAKMANIEESLSLSAPRRRKGTSLGSVSSRSSPKLDTNTSTKELRSVIHDREAIMQNLRVQLGLGKLPRPSGPPFDESEKPAAEQRLCRLKNDVENKKVAIRNLKGALDKLDITDNIDTRIRQAELEYALGREELQLLSIVEEARAIQSRLEKDKTKVETNSLFSIIHNGQTLSLHALKVTTGRWNANQKQDGGGFFVDWVMEGEELYRGDRIIEINGRVLNGKVKEELQKICATNSKCDIVVIRKKTVVNVVPQQQLQQTQADNLRLQHRISYLEEQVKELLDAKEIIGKETSSPIMTKGRSGSHVTSISISSSPNTQSDHDDDRPCVYQRGSFVTRIVDGKPIDPIPSITPPTQSPKMSPNKSTSRTAINRDTNGSLSSKTVKSLSSSLSKISISTDLYVQKQRRERERKERERYYNSKNIRNGQPQQQQQHQQSSITASMNHIENSYNRRKYGTTGSTTMDERSIKSLDFESDGGQGNYASQDDYASEPVPQPRIRPTPPKKPLRLSLQRAQSLQAVMDANGILDSMNLADKKRAIKRIHKGELNEKSSSTNRLHNGHSYSTRSIELSSKYIENNMSTSSLSRQKYV
ncbi:unnamed protein product [Diamesa tonsa]